jgi:hypothetical protein
MTLLYFLVLLSSLFSLSYAVVQPLQDQFSPKMTSNAFVWTINAESQNNNLALCVDGKFYMFSDVFKYSPNFFLPRIKTVNQLHLVLWPNCMMVYVDNKGNIFPLPEETVVKTDDKKVFSELNKQPQASNTDDNSLMVLSQPEQLPVTSTVQPDVPKRRGFVSEINKLKPITAQTELDILDHTLSRFTSKEAESLFKNNSTALLLFLRQITLNFQTIQPVNYDVFTFFKNFDPLGKDYTFFSRMFLIPIFVSYIGFFSNNYNVVHFLLVFYNYYDYYCNGGPMTGTVCFFYFFFHSSMYRLVTDMDIVLFSYFQLFHFSLGFIIYSFCVAQTVETAFFVLIVFLLTIVAASFTIANLVPNKLSNNGYTLLIFFYYAMLFFAYAPEVATLMVIRLNLNTSFLILNSLQLYLSSTFTGSYLTADLARKTLYVLGLRKLCTDQPCDFNNITPDFKRQLTMIVRDNQTFLMLIAIVLLVILMLVLGKVSMLKTKRPVIKKREATFNELAMWFYIGLYRFLFCWKDSYFEPEDAYQTFLTIVNLIKISTLINNPVGFFFHSSLFFFAFIIVRLKIDPNQIDNLDLALETKRSFINYYFNVNEIVKTLKTSVSMTVYVADTIYVAAGYPLTDEIILTVRHAVEPLFDDATYADFIEIDGVKFTVTAINCFPDIPGVDGIALVRLKNDKHEFPKVTLSTRDSPPKLLDSFKYNGVLWYPHGIAKAAKRVMRVFQDPKQPFFRVHVNTEPGDSGSPVLDSDGNIFGVHGGHLVNQPWNYAYYLPPGISNIYSRFIRDKNFSNNDEFWNACIALSKTYKNKFKQEALDDPNQIPLLSKISVIDAFVDNHTPFNSLYGDKMDSLNLQDANHKYHSSLEFTAEQPLSLAQASSSKQNVRKNIKKRNYRKHKGKHKQSDNQSDSDKDVASFHSE